MIKNYFNSRQALKATRTIYTAFIAGLLLYLLVVFYFRIRNLIFTIDKTDAYALATFILCILVIPVGFFVSGRLWSQVVPKDTLRDKYPKYQLGLIIRLAACVSVGLLAAIGFFLSSNLVYIVLLVIPLVAIVLNYPTPERIGKAIDLTPEEVETFYE
jgi:hypothetical protein